MSRSWYGTGESDGGDSDDDLWQEPDQGLDNVPQRLTQEQWIEYYYEDLNILYSSLMRYIENYCTPILGNVDFLAFCQFCYQYSNPYV